MPLGALFSVTATKSGYLVFLFMNGVGTLLMFLMTLILHRTVQVGIGKFNITLTTPYAALFICPFSFFTLLNGMRCFRDRDKKRKSVWYWYLYLKGFLIVGLFGIGIYSFMEGGGSEDIKKLLKETMEQYGGSKVREHEDVTNAWNNFQKRYDCCGVKSYSDWQEVPFGAFLLAAPQSCCLYRTRKFHDCGMNMLPKHEHASEHINTEGCFEKLFGATRKSLFLLGVLLIVLGVNHTITLMSSFLLANVNSMQERSRESKELHELHKMYEPDTQTRNRIYRQHLYMDCGYE